MPEQHWPVRNHRHSWLPAPQRATTASEAPISLAVVPPSIEAPIPLAIAPPSIETPVSLAIAPPSVEAPISAVAPPSVASIPHSTLMAFKKEARDNLRQYALLEKPIRSHDDMAYIEQLVTELTKVHFPKEADAWLLEKSREFETSAKKMLQNVTDTFKSAACILVPEAYSLCVPIDEPLSRAATENHINELLQNWNYVDKDMKLPTGKHAHGVFNHHAIILILRSIVWLQSSKFSGLIPDSINNIDCLLAFTATIIRWVLHAVKRW